MPFFFIKKIIVLFILSIVWSYGCSTKQKNPLLGSWQSNEIETLKEMRMGGAYTENQIKLITSKVSFGNVFLEIDEETISAHFEGNKSKGSYRIISIEEPLVIIESYNPITEEIEILAIEVRENRLWMPSTAVDFREVFTRIP
jgi:hypothetical protein